MILILFFPVLEEMENHPAAREFIDPVNTKRAADYYDLISNPMCLSSMMIKVCEDVYKTIDEVRITINYTLQVFLV